MEKYRRTPNTFCVICNKPIYRRPGQISENKGRVFCSIDCYGKSIRKEVSCLVCGKSILAGLNKKTCSRSCANQHREGIKYKMGSPHNKVVYLKGLKMRLLKLRSNHCQRCGYNRSEILQIHHKDKNHHNNELDNLELICPNCHYEKHFLEKSWLKGYNLSH